MTCRSNKVAEVKSGPFAEIAWWFPQVGVVLEVRQRLEIIVWF